MIKIFKTATVPESIHSFLSSQIKYLSKNGFEVYSLSAKGDSELDIEKHLNIKKHYIVNLKRKISILNDIISVIQVYFILIKVRPTIVHSITPKAGLITMMASYLARVPIRIHTFTGLIFPTKKGLFKTLLIFIDKLICKFATHIYPEGLGVLNDLLKYQITAKPLKVIGNGNISGIDENYYNIKNHKRNDLILLKKELGISEKDFIFLFVGRLVEDKGINELVAAFLQLNSIFSSIKLLLVGPYEERNAISKITKLQIGANSNIICTGFVKDVRSYFAISNIFVFPSYREGFPNVLLQAACYSLPIIASNISGCNEIVLNNKNGILIESQNIEDLFDKMELLYNDKYLQNGFKDCTRNIIVEKYNQMFVQEKLLLEYYNLNNNL